MRQLYSYVANECTLRLSCTYQWLSRGGGGVTPGTYAGMARDWSSLFFNFKPGMGRLDCFCTFVAASPVEDPRDLYRRRHFTDGAGNESRSRLQKDWVRLVNTFWQNGDRKDGKGLSYFSCILFLLAGHPSLS